MVLRLCRPCGSTLAGFIEDEVDLGEREAGKLDLELQVDQPLQFECEQFLIPALRAGIDRPHATAPSCAQALQRAGHAQSCSPRPPTIIEPTLGEPGHECPKCVYVTGELVQPTRFRRRCRPPER